MSHVFVSHASKDKVPLIHDFIRILAWANIPIWVDKPGCIPNGLGFENEYIDNHNIQHINGEWRADITLAIKRSSVVLICLTRNYDFSRDILVEELSLGHHEDKALYCVLDDLDLNQLPDYQGLVGIGTQQFNSLNGTLLGKIATKLEEGGEQAVSADSELWTNYQAIQNFLKKIKQKIQLPEFNGPSLLDEIANSSQGIATLTDLLSFQRRQTTLVGRDSEQKSFVDFLNAPFDLSWQLLVGASGIGKSRFAQEVCEKARLNGWIAGFIHKRTIKSYPWDSWNPNRNCLFVIDDPDDITAEDIHFAITSLAGRDFTHSVRWLIIERSRNGLWYDNFIPEGEFGSEIIKDLEYEKDLELSSLNQDDWEAIVAESYNHSSSVDPVPPKEFRELLRQRRLRTNERRPIQAIMIGAYLANYGNIAYITNKMHLMPTLESEFLADLTKKIRNCFNKIDDPKGAERATVMATIQKRTIHIDLKTQDECTPNNSAELILKAEPIKPDLLGEFFTLEYLRECSKTELKDLLEVCWIKKASKTRQFLMHTLEDFPDSNFFKSILDANIRPNGQNYNKWIQFELDILKHFYNEENFWRLNKEIMIGLNNAYIENDPGIITRLLSRAPSFEIANNIFNTVCKTYSPISIIHYNIMLGFAPKKYIPTLLKEIEAEKLQINDITCRAIMYKTDPSELMTRLRSCEKDFDELPRPVYEAAFQSVDEHYLPQLFKDFEETQHTFSHNIVATILRQHPPQLAIYYLKKIENSDFRVRQSDYQICINALCRKYFSEAFLIIEFLISVGRRPFRHLLTTLLASAPDEENFQKTLNLYKSLGYNLDLHIYTVLMQRWSLSQSKREDLYEDMLEEGIEPDDFVFNAIMSRCNDFDTAYNWLTKMEKRGRIPTAFHFAPLCKLADNKNWRDIQNKMSQYKVTFDNRCAKNILINYRVTLSEDDLNLILSEVQESHDWVSSQFYRQWLKRSGSLDIAIAKLGRLSENGIDRDEYMIAALCDLSPTIEQAINFETEFFEESGVTSGIISNAVFGCAIRLKTEFSLIEGIFDRLNDENAHIDIKKIEHLINGANALQSRKIIHTLEDHGIRLTKKILDIGLTKIINNDPVEGMKLYDAYVFDYKAGNMLLDSIARHATFSEAVLVLQKHLKSGSNLDETILLSVAKSASSLDECHTFLDILHNTQLRLTNLLIFAVTKQLIFSDHYTFFKEILLDGHIIILDNWERLIEKANAKELTVMTKQTHTLGTIRLIWVHLIKKSPTSDTRKYFKEMKGKKLPLTPEIYAACIQRSTSFDDAFWFIRVCARDLKKLTQIEFEEFKNHLNTKKQLFRIVGFVEKEKVELDSTLQNDLEQFLSDKFSSRTSDDILQILSPFFSEKILISTSWEEDV